MSLFRNTVWYLKGLREYTREGYTTAAKSFQAGELEVDCSGLSYLVTGANSGLGKQTARELASRGGTVHLVCRNPDTGEEAREEISGLTRGDSKVHLHILDISQPEKVAEFVTEFQSSQEKLDVLVNNAGCMVAARELTKEGLDRNWATNVLGTYLLTTGLLPLLQRADKPRVVTVSSGGMLVQKLTAEDPQSEQMEPYDGTMAYAQNKRQQVVLTEHWAAQHPAVHFSVMHPGWADTPAVRTAMPDFHKSMGSRLRTVEEGADTMLWLAVTQQAVQQPSGSFWQDRRPVATHLPLAWTRTSVGETAKLVSYLDNLKTKYFIAN